MNKTQLTKELECPVCFQIPRNPPIYQCINGHLICSICQEKIKDICPLITFRCLPLNSFAQVTPLLINEVTLDGLA